MRNVVIMTAAMLGTAPAFRNGRNGRDGHAHRG
jgi:hypothetical protein